MDKPPKRFDAIDWLLMAAIVGLSVFLISEMGPPLVEAWQNRPQPGVQVRQQSEVEIKSHNTVDSNNTNSNDAHSNRGHDANDKTPVNYLLYLPQDYYKDRTKKWPLVVFLHGSGERGNDLELVRSVGLPNVIEQSESSDVADMVHKRFIFVSPQCPSDTSWMPEIVVGLVDTIVKSYAVDPDRVYLTGFSMGGFGTWATAGQYPEPFAAIAPLAGGGNVDQAERLKTLPIWAFHGGKDETVPMKSSETMVEAVKKCGGNVQFTIYPEAGHGICDVTYKSPKFYEWLLAQRRNSPQQEHASSKPESNKSDTNKPNE
jgi:predicted peptidase